MTRELREKISRLLISPNMSLIHAMKRMDELQVKLLIVMDGDQFWSVLSIGDLQRAIIRNVTMEEQISTIIRKDVLVAGEQEDRATIKKNMLLHRTECMPVINDQKKLVDVYFWDELLGGEQMAAKSALNLQVVVMAGGKGTRLRPITNVIPKPLIPLGEKTILEHIMEHFVQAGCTDFLMSLNYKSDMIVQYLEEKEDARYRVTFIREKQFLGTAGSLYLLKKELKNTFFVTNCDIIIDTDYAEIYDYHKAHANDITIVGVVKHLAIPYGVLESGAEGLLTSIREKPELNFKINSGMYILEPEVLAHVPDNLHLHITELIEVIRAKGGKVGVYPVSEGAWMDIGEWDEYNKVLKKFGQHAWQN